MRMLRYPWVGGGLGKAGMKKAVARKQKVEVPVEESREDLQRQLAEEYLKYSDFLRKNKIYAFRAPSVAEAEMERVMGERFFYPPNPKQQEVLDAWLNPQYKTFSITGANQIGKTTLEVVLIYSILAGYYLWNDQRIPFPHGRPRKIRYVGQGWESHIKATIIPTLEEWRPHNRPYDTKKNNQGIDAYWKDMITGSTMEIMSNSQETSLFEGWVGDFAFHDEPPDRDKWIANARGLIARQGRAFIGATLLKEAWIYREVVKGRLESGKPDPGVYNVHAEITDNLGYGLTQEGIDRFARSLNQAEKEARLHGKPSCLATLVYPSFNRDEHVKPEFKIPLDWIVDISIDFHPSKPWALVFLATSRTGFKYVCKEMELRGNPKFVGEEIVRYIRQNNLRVGRCVIDPLAKGDENNDTTVYGILEQVLASYNISLDVASKDKDNGIAAVNALLWTENEMPGLYFFDTCPRTIQQVEDLMYDPETLKPTAVKVDDDFTECLYRLALLDTQWFPETNYDMSEQRSVLL